MISKDELERQINSLGREYCRCREDANQRARTAALYTRLLTLCMKLGLADGFYSKRPANSLADPARDAYLKRARTVLDKYEDESRTLVYYLRSHAGHIKEDFARAQSGADPGTDSFSAKQAPRDLDVPKRNPKLESEIIFKLTVGAISLSNAISSFVASVSVADGRRALAQPINKGELNIARSSMYKRTFFTERTVLYVKARRPEELDVCRLHEQSLFKCMDQGFLGCVLVGRYGNVDELIAADVADGIEPIPRWGEPECVKAIKKWTVPYDVIFGYLDSLEIGGEPFSCTQNLSASRGNYKKWVSKHIQDVVVRAGV